MSVRIYTAKVYDGEADSGLAANSLDLTATPNAFVKKTGNVVSLSAAGELISGMALTQAVFASDNQTVAAKTVEFVPPETNFWFDVTITAGTITVADEGKFYDLSDSVTVDGTTESTTTGQLELMKFHTATNCAFRIANK